MSRASVGVPVTVTALSNLTPTSMALPGAYIRCAAGVERNLTSETFGALAAATVRVKASAVESPSPSVAVQVWAAAAAAAGGVPDSTRVAPSKASQDGRRAGVSAWETEPSRSPPAG